MKYKCEVIIEKTIVLDIPDHMLSDEAVEEFKTSIDRYADFKEDLVVHAAQIIALNPDATFVEGVGEVSNLNDGLGIYIEENSLDMLDVDYFTRLD